MRLYLHVLVQTKTHPNGDDLTTGCANTRSCTYTITCTHTDLPRVPFAYAAEVGSAVPNRVGMDTGTNKAVNMPASKSKACAIM